MSRGFEPFIRGVGMLSAATLLNSIGSTAVAAQRAVSVRVTDDTLRLIRAADKATLKTNLVIRNDGQEVLYYDPNCGPVLQRETKGAWLTVWDQECLLVVSKPRALAAGDSVVIPAQFVGYTTENWFPKFDSRVVPGVYRLVPRSMGFKLDQSGWRVAEPLSLDQRSSAPLILRATQEQ